MTESPRPAPPRRSYPLVVAPPGGFEDAVRRGRRIRRRRTSGSTGAAVLVVGALAYALVGHGADTSSLHPTHQTIDRTTHTVTGTPTPTPTATPSGTLPTSGPGHVVPGVSYTGRGSSTAPRPNPTPAHQLPGVVGQPYAHRNGIEQSTPFTNTNTGCLMDASAPDWCAYADVTADQSNGTYTLSYTLCRNVNAGGGHLTFSRTLRADFAAVDPNNETVWTYSAGQPLVSANGGADIAGGYCVTWAVVWDGYDDFSATPPPGQYELRAKSLATGTYPEPTVGFTHY